MPLSSYAQQALAPSTPTPTGSKTPSTNNGTTPLSSYAQSSLTTPITNPDTQNYQTAFANTPTPAPSFIQNLGTDVMGALTKPLEPSSYNPVVAAKTNPLVVPETLWNTVKSAVTDAGNRLAQTYTSVPAAISGKGSKLQAATDVASAGLGTVSALFSPISGLLAGAAKMPVIGVAAGAVNNLFGDIGSGVRDTEGAYVDALPVSDATKAKIRPVAKEAGALVAQIIAGKAGADAIGLLKDKTTQIIDHVQADTAPTKLSDYAQAHLNSTEYPTAPKTPPVAPETPVSKVTPAQEKVDMSSGVINPDGSVDFYGKAPRTLADVHQEIEQTQGQYDFLEELVNNHPAKPFAKYNSEGGNALEDINARNIGKGTKSAKLEELAQEQGYPDLVAAQKGLSDYRDLQNDLENTKASLKSLKAEAKSFVSPKVRTSSGPLKPIEGTGELKTRGLSQNIEASAIEKKLADNFGDLPEYKTVSMADQARQAADLLIKDPESAREIAMGNKAPPKGLLPESVLVAVEHDATEKGDVQTLQDLANSKLASSATTMGQRIRTLGERDNISPTNAIREVQAAREADLAKRGATIKEDATARIADSIKKTNTVKSWSDFIASIEC